MTVRLTHDGSFDAPNPNRAMLYFVERVGPNTSAYDNVYCTVKYLLNCPFPPQYYPRFDARKLWIKRALRQPNRHVSNEPSCVNRTVMRQPSCVKVWIGLYSSSYFSVRLLSRTVNGLSTWFYFHVDNLPDRRFLAADNASSFCRPVCSHFIKLKICSFAKTFAQLIIVGSLLLSYVSYNSCIIFGFFLMPSIWTPPLSIVFNPLLACVCHCHACRVEQSEVNRDKRVCSLVSLARSRAQTRRPFVNPPFP